MVVREIGVGTEGSSLMKVWGIAAFLVDCPGPDLFRVSDGGDGDGRDAYKGEMIANNKKEGWSEHLKPNLESDQLSQHVI